MSNLDVRRCLTVLIGSLLSAGNRDGARKIAEFAVEQGYWARADQRPVHFVPDLWAEPVHDAAEYPIAQYFNNHAEIIRRETLGLLGENGDGLLPVEERLTDAGAWNVGTLYEDGARSSRNCARFPRTAAIIESAPEEIRRAGVVALSWLSPGTHILPHCGFTNARLRLHLPLLASPGAFMRVGTRKIMWEDGCSLVFDDSFEHEVHHEGAAPRLVLIADFFHPAFGAVERVDFIRHFNRSPTTKVTKFMEEVGLESLALDKRGSFCVRFMMEHDRRIRRYMEESGAEAVSVAETGAALVEPAKSDRRRPDGSGFSRDEMDS
jgi:aspartyl/asparaginyl beta-hydroxylase (cupin superfamily)